MLLVLVLAAVGWEAYCAGSRAESVHQHPGRAEFPARRLCLFRERPAPPRTASSEPFLLAPPKDVGPIVVRARFALHDINEINDGAETFEFTGVLTLTWHDPRQAFDPAVVGVEEKIFQGSYQADELATG